MRLLDLLKREQRIAFGARATWFVLATSVLLASHSFVLAIDLYSAESRSALGYNLMRREMDPLLGVVRPMLGALQLAGALLVPVIAARGLLHRARTHVVWRAGSRVRGPHASCSPNGSPPSAAAVCCLHRCSSTAPLGSTRRDHPTATSSLG